MAVGGFALAMQAMRLVGAGRRVRESGRAARLFYLVKDINFIDANRQTSHKHCHLRYAFHLVLFCFFLLVNCLNATKCANKTNGTITDGNKLNGKYNTATLGCSNANF